MAVALHMIFSNAFFEKNEDIFVNFTGIRSSKSVSALV